MVYGQHGERMQTAQQPVVMVHLQGMLAITSEHFSSPYIFMPPTNLYFSVCPSVHLSIRPSVHPYVQPKILSAELLLQPLMDFVHTHTQ